MLRRRHLFRFGAAGTAFQAQDGTMWAAGAIVAILSACAMGAVSTWLLDLVVRSADAGFAAAKTRRFAVGAAAMCAAAGLVAAGSLPWPAWLPWIGFACVGVWLACVDAVTDVVPRSVSHIAAGLILILTAAQAIVERSANPLFRAFLGGISVWLLFAGWWLIARGAVGFGDVRFSLPWAMTAAAASWQHLALAVVLGSVLALLFGIVRRVRLGTATFPYTPGLAAGLFAAAAVLAVR